LALPDAQSGAASAGLQSAIVFSERWKKLYARWLARRFDRATAADVYYCYRLFLQRRPDAGGWTEWTKLIRRNGLSVQALAEAFLYSEEFRTTQEDRWRPRLIELDEFKMYVRPNDFYIGAAIAREHAYEPHVTAEIRRCLLPGGVFVDLGANLGYFTLLAAARVGARGRVIAFEPNPRNCDLLRHSIDANGFAHVELHPCAVAEQERRLMLDTQGTTSTGLVVDPVPGGGKPLVQAVALDDTLRDVGRVDLIKMDIEGGEPRALRGMPNLLRTHRPIIVTEFCPVLLQATSQVAPRAFLDELRAFEYELFILHHRSVTKSAAPQSNDEIMAAHARSGLTHLDLVAYPRAGGGTR